ncbi:response regulator [Dongia deserti]|uniref:response regulator n=1 Tax=Dongia deserti TaxID=2268030 RepID=UPI000E649904|nr:response regulator [Dongia deserti]
MSSQDKAWESLRGLQILLVEDDPLICLDLESSLSEMGAVVVTSANVAAALQVVASSALDFAVLDFELGRETSEPIAKAARERQVPFLYLSGYDQEDERFRRWPGVAVLVKPISAVMIARRIREIVGGRP